MKPMGITFTQFISYHEIKTRDIDLFEDAFGVYNEFYDVIDTLKQLKPVASNQMTRKLIRKIRKQG